MYIQDLNICVFIPNYEESYMAKFCGARDIFRGDPVLHHIHYPNHYIVSEFCTTERIPYMTRNLTTVHRNSHKVASYLCECTPHIDTLVYTSPHGGDGVYVEHMSNIRENSGNNELLMHINRLTDPRNLPPSGFELATQWSEAQHATAGLRRPPQTAVGDDAELQQILTDMMDDFKETEQM